MACWPICAKLSSKFKIHFLEIWVIFQATGSSPIGYWVIIFDPVSTLVDRRDNEDCTMEKEAYKVFISISCTGYEYVVNHVHIP